MAYKPVPSSAVDEQDKWLEDAQTAVSQQSFNMKRALDTDNLREALKFSSGMICELRTGLFSPKHYYDLFITVTNELRSLETYFCDLMAKGRRIIELYELVQHAGNILPRLYLLITVGSVYIKSKQAPVKDILKDLVEMCRGVQHPMRGLFLRNYLLQMIKDKLPDTYEDPEDGVVDDSISFIVENFTEMTKLWVRMQNQGQANRDAREKDRENRERERQELRILVGYNLVRLSQLEAIDVNKYKTTVLPKILEQVVNYKDQIAQQYLMDCIIQVFPDEYHTQTLELFLNTCLQLQPGVDIKVIFTGIMSRLSLYAEQNPGAITADIKIFDLFSVNISRVATTMGSKLALVDQLILQVGLLSLVLRCYNDRLDYVDQILSICSQAIGDTSCDRETAAQIVELLTLPVQAYKNILVILTLDRYGTLLEKLPHDMRRKVAFNVVTNVVKHRTVINEFSKIEKLFDVCKPILEEDPQAITDEEDFEDEQTVLAKLIYFLSHDDPQVRFQIYQLAWRAFSKGPKRLKYLAPPLVFGLLNLALQIKPLEEAGSIQISCQNLFKLVHEIVMKIATVKCELAFRLFLQCAALANRVQYEVIAYEFMTQAFVIYEDEITDSKMQFNSVALVTGTLHTLANFTTDNYDTLATKTTQHAAKLLHKSDQCRAVSRCAHLFWSPPRPNAYRDPTLVMKCLTRANTFLKAVMEPPVSAQLCNEMLNRFLWFFREGCDTVRADHVSEMISLATEKIKEVPRNGAENEAIHTNLNNLLTHIRNLRQQDPTHFGTIMMPGEM